MKRTLSLFGETGSGKTTLIGELAKHQFKSDHTKTLLHAADRGGFESLLPLIKLGVIDVNLYDPSTDPWLWVNAAASTPPPDGVGLVAFDSGTSISEAILSYISKSDLKVGAQATQKFTVTQKGGKPLVVGANNMNHYGIVQTFMLDQIWKSTWLAQAGPDILWTFSADGAEDDLNNQVAGPKLAGHALTHAIPKWFNYCFRTASIPVSESVPRHVLYMQEHTENGRMGFGNARYPLDAQTSLPLTIEPASLVAALGLIEKGQEEAETNLREELGL